MEETKSPLILTRKKTVVTDEQLDVQIPSYWVYGNHETFLYKLESESKYICVRDHENDESISFYHSKHLLERIASGEVSPSTEARFNEAIQKVKSKIEQL